MTQEPAGAGTAVEATGDAIAKSAPVVGCDVAAALVTTLPQRGLDRLTPSRIESVFCTSALTAHM
jgi:hypothetical protein